jgi:hypothetical protein
MATPAMRKKKQVRGRKVHAKKHVPFVLGTMNYVLFGLGMLIVIVGYVSLAQGPADSFWSLTLAPILLVIGYVIVIPLAIMYKGSKSQQPQARQ